MNDQKYFEESYLSLSAFLSIESKNEAQCVESTQNVKEKQIVDNFKGSEQNGQNDCFQDSQSNQSSKGDLSQSKTRIVKSKRQKKEYSKNYRQRHKEYVDNLRITNQKLQKKVQELNLKIDMMTEELQSLKYGQKSNDNYHDNIFVRERQQKILELSKQAEIEGNVTWEKVRQFREFFGFAGKTKFNLLNYYMSQIVDNLLVDHLKNFILSGLGDFDITKDYTKHIYEKERQIMECSKQSFTHLLKYLRKFMAEKVKNFHKSGQEFYESYIKLTNSAKDIQNQFQNIKEGVYKVLTPKQYLNILKWFEENKYSKEIQTLRKDWFESFRQN